jgi:hypothetical protein
VLVKRRALVVLALAAACSGGSSDVVRPPETPPATASPTLTAAPTPTAIVARHPTVRVVPSTGLEQGQVVTVTGKGFTPGEALVVVQCLSRGTATGASDCNVPGLVSVRADAAGGVTAKLPVSKGPYGSPPLLCSAAHPCLVSISQAQLNPTEEADAPISFR